MTVEHSLGSVLNTRHTHTQTDRLPNRKTERLTTKCTQNVTILPIPPYYHNEY